MGAKRQAFCISRRWFGSSAVPFTSYALGQPMPFTHPHLLSAAELTPGITLKEYGSRRKKLFEKLSPGSALIIPCNLEPYFTWDVATTYRQEPNLFYFTGFQESGCAVVLEKEDSPTQDEKFTMFVRLRDPARELWDGPITGVEAARSVFQATEAYSLAEFPIFLEKLLARSHTIYYEAAADEEARRYDTNFNYHVFMMFAKAYQARTKSNSSDDGSVIANSTAKKDATNSQQVPDVVKSRTLIEEERVIKSEAELAIMKRAGKISGRSFGKMMARTKPGMLESELEDIFVQECKKSGSRHMAYSPIVAGGANANVLHYIRNDQILRDGDLVLVDAGCELHNYSSDITRTFPVNGKFTEPQRQLYNAVLEVQLMCIDMCVANGKTSLESIQEAAKEMLTAKLTEFGLLPSPAIPPSLLSMQLSHYYPHSVGHQLGLETHDCSSLSRSLPLQPGMVVTIEPGLYIPSVHPLLARFHSESSVSEVDIAAAEYIQTKLNEFGGTGIRIEDNIMVGKVGSGPTVLTSLAPKSPEEIERAMQQM